MEIASYGSIRDSEICRTCLLELFDDTKIFYLDSVISTTDKTTIRHKLRDCIPELDLNVTPNAAICFDCLSSINFSHNFKKKCLQTEKNITRYTRRTGSIFVDLVQLVEQNKKSHQYPDLYPIEIKQEPGLSESHTYTRFFVKQEPVDTPADISDDDDFYQDSIDDGYSENFSTSVKQDPIQPLESRTLHKEPTKPKLSNNNNSIVKNVTVKNEPIKAPSNCVQPSNNKRQAPIAQKSKPAPTNNPVKTIITNSVNPITKTHNDVKEKLLGNCAISLQEVPKIKNNNNTVLTAAPMSEKPVECKSESNSIKCKPEPVSTNDFKVTKVEPQEIKVETKVIPEATATLQKTVNKKVKVTPRRLTRAATVVSKQKKLVKPTTAVSQNLQGIQMKPDASNVVYAILTLVKPQNDKTTQPPELVVPSKLDVSNPALPIQEKSVTPSGDGKQELPPVIIKREPTPNYKNEDAEVVQQPPKVQKPPTPPLPHPSPPFIRPSTPLLVPISKPPKLVKIEPKPVKIETKPVASSAEEKSLTEQNRDTTDKLGYNIDINDIPPLVPIHSDTTAPTDSLTNFGDDITHLECTPNIADYVDDELEDDDSLHKCNDCEFECNSKSEFILHLSTHLEEKFGIKPEPIAKKRDLYGRIKTLGGKLVYECEVCNYRTALKRRYMFHRKLHEENKLLQCTQCNYLCATKSNLNVHMAVHTGLKPHKCTECGYSTVSKSALVVHTRIHTGDRPYSCGVCGYCTISKSALLVHNRIHTGSKPYRCPTCNYRTITKSALTVHMRTHTGDKPFKCHLCDYSTRAKSALNVHVRIHEGYKPYQCTECEYRCSQRSGLNVHMRVHTGDKPFSCTECEYKCSNKSSLVVHYRTHTGETPYKCEECDYTTAWKSALNVHTRIHGDRKPFKCTECDYKCAQRSTLNVHMRIHTGDKPYQCLECDYRCRYQGNLKMHMRVHTRETPYQCNMCPYSTTAKSALIVHTRIHTGEKPFKCSECSYRCSTKSSLKIHSRIHTGETPYECKRCLYKASSNSALKVHLRIHTGEKPFKCSYCSYRASNKGSIKVHLRVHTGETPYGCSICDYKTTAKSALIVHMRIHTGDKPYKCEECSYRCNNKSSLKVHLKVHTGRTPYRCEICDYRCKKKFVLKRHLRVHREDDGGEDNESVEANDNENENELPYSPDHLVTVKNEIDESMDIDDDCEMVNEEEEDNDEEEVVENLVESGYEADLDVTTSANIQPEFSVIAV